MEKLTLKAVRRINKEFRAKDDSDLWPILSEFNVTERAIRRLRRQQRQDLYIETDVEYRYALEAEISRIVNSH